jgi:hypothetical protein
MARLIHYKLATLRMGFQYMYTEHNTQIGGYGELSTKGVKLVKRKIRKKHNRALNNNDIVICNVMELKEE